MELERKLRETLEHRVAEQQKKLEDLNNTSISAEHFRDSTQIKFMENHGITQFQSIWSQASSSRC
jgi:uncharacterized coiled-coil protein SlyX